MTGRILKPVIMCVLEMTDCLSQVMMYVYSGDDRQIAETKEFW